VIAPIGREIRLARRPQGDPKITDFEVAEATPAPPPGAGQVQLKVRWISVDPMIRIFIDARPLGGAGNPLPIGSVVPGPALAEVIASEHPDFMVGDHVEGRIGWREFATVQPAGLRKVDPAHGALSAQLGVLGLPGFSAYVGLGLLGDLGPGKSLLISGAGGAVGSVAGPLAKLRGARTIGIAGGEARCRALVDELGYDVALDRRAADFPERLAEAAGAGFDAYFENVGGDIFDLALPHLRRGGQVVICGLMAQYGGGGEAATDRLPATLLTIMRQGLTVRAFSNTEHRGLLAPFHAEVGALLATGKLPSPEHVAEGFEATPDAFCRLFTHSVLGKSLVRVA